MSFRIAIGKEEGDKQVEGDNRTPEGIYFAQKIIDGETLPAKYGPFAIPINFPNPYDRHLGKTGYGIWLHGVKEDARVEESKVTEGCVAFYNADIVSLSDWLEPSQSVVVIAKSAAEVNRPRDVATVKERTRQWYRAWSERDHDRYLSFYDESFRSRGMNRDQYGAYKKRVFGLYDEMLVDIFNIRVFTHKSYAVSLFNQNFNGDDRYVSEGRKVLYWERHDDGSWRIVHEVFDSGRFKLQSFSRDYLVRLSEESPSAKHIAKDNVNSSM
jgi:murein L,D-transpeptidase YafK